MQQDKRNALFDALAAYRARVMYLLAIISVVVIVPFAINDFLQGRTLMGIFVLGVVAILGADAIALYRGKVAPVPWWLLFASVVFSVAMSIRAQGLVGMFWPFPSVVFFHFVLRRRIALIFSISMLLLITPLAYHYLGVSVTIRMVVALTLTIVFSTIFIGIITDLQQKLEMQATIDPLTGALNRRQLEEFIETAIAQHGRSGAPASVLILDLDHFKSINDEYGHAIGDAVLKDVVTAISSRNRRADRLFRIGGEEFLLLLPDTGQSAAIGVAETMRQLIESGPLVPERTVTVSIGVSELSPGDTMESWLKRADDALYRAKQQGRNVVEGAGWIPEPTVVLESDEPQREQG